MDRKKDHTQSFFSSKSSQRWVTGQKPNQTKSKQTNKIPKTKTKPPKPHFVLPL